MPLIHHYNNHGKSRYRHLRRAAVVVGVVGAGALTTAYFLQDVIIFHPRDGGTTYESHNPERYRSPAEWDLPFIDINVWTSDDEMLKGWFIGDALTAPSRPTIIVFTGNAGNVGWRLPFFSELYNRLDANIVTVNYRGYGSSTGTPSEKGFYEDAESILKVVKQMGAKGYLDPSRVFVYGKSMGGAVAVELAHRHPETIKGVILENTFTSLPKMMDRVIPGASYLPNWMKDNFLWHKMYSEDKISSKKLKNVPFLFISGSADRLVPPDHMKTLRDKCSSDTKWFMNVKGGSHMDCWRKGKDVYFRTAKEFVNGPVQGLCVKVNTARKLEESNSES